MANLWKQKFLVWLNSYRFCNCFVKYDVINSTWSNVTIWWHRSWSTLAQVMACCLAAPNHYLNQCWLIISELLWRSPEGKFHRKPSRQLSPIRVWNIWFNIHLPGLSELIWMPFVAIAWSRISHALQPCAAFICGEHKNIFAFSVIMMTSSNGNIFHVTGPLCGEFTGHQWIPLTKASDAELWCFLWFALEQMVWVNNRYAGDLRRHQAY